MFFNVIGNMANCHFIYKKQDIYKVNKEAIIIEYTT